MNRRRVVGIIGIVALTVLLIANYHPASAIPSIFYGGEIGTVRLHDVSLEHEWAGLALIGWGGIILYLKRKKLTQIEFWITEIIWGVGFVLTLSDLSGLRSPSSLAGASISLLIGIAYCFFITLLIEEHVEVHPRG